MRDLLCVVTPHEKGFWQADVYLDGFEEGELPDWFCTGSIDGTKEQIIAKVKKTYPNAKFEDGVTGVCTECGELHFNLEQVCAACGEIVGDT